MKKLACLLIYGSHLFAAPATETLQYSINWPSGLNLGEGKVTSTSTEKGWELEMQFEAAIPGFKIADKFQSLMSGQNCSVTFQKDTQHGKKRTQEKISFDGEKGVAIRQTIGGGKSELRIAACPKDALAFLFYLRRELAMGRIPPAQEVYYGSAYRVRLQFKGAQKIRFGDGMEDTDRILIGVKGPASELEIEAFLAKDAARTPLVVKVPLGMATFSVELVR